MRHGGLRLRQLGAAVAHCKLDPFVANFMKVLCSQGIYRYNLSIIVPFSVTIWNMKIFHISLRYALMEMGYDPPDIPTGMATTFHLKKCTKPVFLSFSFVYPGRNGLTEKYHHQVRRFF